MAIHDVMLDDITFKYCREGDVPAGSNQLTCDFEKDTCSWYHNSTTGLLWSRNQGSYGDNSPGYDHTIGKGERSTVSLVSGILSVCMCVCVCVCSLIINVFL